MHIAMTSANLYQQLIDLPETLTGGLLDGRLHTRPSLTGPQHCAKMALSYRLFEAFRIGGGGQGGWRILPAVEIHFELDAEVAVPDLAGWRRERMPALPEGHRIEVVPDWVCEILTPATAAKDRDIKMPLYLRRGVHHAWLIDPDAQTLDTFEAGEGGAWRQVGRTTGDDQVSLSMWVLADDCGLVANNVGPVADNVGPRPG